MNTWNLDHGSLSIEQGDITALKVNAIVNAANPMLAGGGGVDGAIHRAAGPELPKACRAIVAKSGKLPAGEAVTTPGFNLHASYIIHTVGPIWRGGDKGESETLLSCYRSCIREAEAFKCNTLAFPAISCGVYGFPTVLAAPLALEAIASGLGNVKECKMVIHGSGDLEIWISAARKLFGIPD